MIYLDYQATTPLAPEAAEAMRRGSSDISPTRTRRPLGARGGGGDRGRAGAGRAAIGPGGSVAFTGGATEALNWALKGTSSAPPGRNRIVTSPPSMPRCSTLRMAGGAGASSRAAAGRPDGLLDLGARARSTRHVLLVAVMLVNNEIGVIQPVAEIARLAHGVGALMLCDAVQGLGRVAIPTGRT
jgi:cysteine desulfurase